MYPVNKMTLLSLALIFITCSFIGLSLTQESWAQPIIPEQIPQGFDFPASREVLQEYADTHNVLKIREHSWNIWAGMTAPSKSTHKGKTLPIWETWLGTKEVFVVPTSTKEHKLNAPARAYQCPTQFHHFQATGKFVETPSCALVSFNRFDPTMASYLNSQHKLPGKSNQSTIYYTQAKDLAKLNASWTANTPVRDRKVQDAPPTAMELKPVLGYVRSDKLTALPLWRGPTASSYPSCEVANILYAILSQAKHRLNVIHHLKHGIIAYSLIQNQSIHHYEKPNLLNLPQQINRKHHLVLQPMSLDSTVYITLN